MVGDDFITLLRLCCSYFCVSFALPFASLLQSRYRLPPNTHSPRSGAVRRWRGPMFCVASY